MEVNNNLKKIQLILKYIFEGRIVIQENYVEKLLKFLEDNDENSPGKLILDTPCFSDLVYQVLGDIHNATASAKVFLVQIIAVIFKNELQFNKMHLQGFKSFCKLNTVFDSNPPPNLYLACLKLTTVLITHSSGLKFILKCKLWKNILHPNIHLRPKHISNAVYTFIASLVSKVNEYNLETELIEILEHVLDPIRKSDYFNLPAIDIETDTALSDQILTHVSVLLAIVTEANKSGLDNKVTPLLKEYFVIDHTVFEIYFATKNNGLLQLLNALVFRMSIGLLQPLLFNKKTDEFCIKMTASYRNLLISAISRRDPFIIMDYIIQSKILWSQIEKNYTTELNFPLIFEQNGHKIEFALQIVIPVIVPVINYVSLLRISRKLPMSDIMEQFLAKMSKTFTDFIVSCCFKFGEMLEESDINFRRKVVTQALKELLRLKGHLSETQAGVIFQCLYYFLEMFILFDEAGALVVNENPMDYDDLKVLSHLLNVMKMLLKEHNISWYENVEIVIVQADLLNLLKQNFLFTKQVVQVLDLLDICVKKFLSPNMSLLVEGTSRQANTLNEIGEVIKLYTQHEEWEVRDSAFNLLKSCTDISFIKYIPLQKVIKGNNLIILAAKAGLNDPEYYSQCTALRCLAAATKIDSIWQEVLMDNEYFCLQLVYILRNHTEGMVRKEAANVLIGVYINQKIESNFQNNLYDVMTSAALDDLHWEVQLVALQFWKKVIHSHLTYRGMIDGKFPSVTFSKEKRKIMVLHKEEIQRQLVAVMNGLSAVGCLTVLVECMNEIHNIDVMIQAYTIAKELIEILDKYKFQKLNNVTVKTEEKLPQYKGDRHIPLDLSGTQSVEDRDKVINSILSEDQTELIIHLHDNFTQTKSDEMDIDYSCYYQQRKLVHPNEFLDNFRDTDYSLIIDCKKNFYADNIGTFDALLDEILDLKSN